MTGMCFPDAPLPALHQGWYLLGVASEFGRGITSVQLGERPLIALRDRNQIRVFDATCPHRGAHLGYGGRLADGAMICPFHGKRIALGGPGQLSVAEHRALRAGDAVFVRLSAEPEHDRGFSQFISDLVQERCLIGVLCEHVPVAPEMIVENAFDAEHFSSVHYVPRVTGMEIKPGETGELVIEGQFATAPTPWEKSQEAVIHSRFLARAYSPGLVVTELGPPDRAHVVITAASPAPGGGCTARIVLAIRPGQLDEFSDLAAGARHAFQQDLRVWSHLSTSITPRLDARDVPVVAFRRFCAEFPAS